MEENKSPLKSKTMWAGFFTIVVGLLGLIGVDLPLDPEAHSELVITVIGAVMVVLRAVTSTGIKLP